MGWVVALGCVVHVDVHGGHAGSRVAGGCILIEYGRCDLSCMQKVWGAMSSAESVAMACWHFPCC